MNMLAWNNKIGLRRTAGRFRDLCWRLSNPAWGLRGCREGLNVNVSSGGYSILLVSRAEVMVDRDSWGCWYCRARGEILGFWQDQLMRKHSPRMSSLIKNES